MNLYCTLWFLLFVIWVKVVVKNRLLSILYFLASRWCHQWRWPAMFLREFPNYGNWSTLWPAFDHWAVLQPAVVEHVEHQHCICQRQCDPKEHYYSCPMHCIVCNTLSSYKAALQCYIPQQQHPPLPQQPKLTPTPAEQQNGDDKLPNSVAIACVWGWMTCKEMTPITTAQNIDDMMIIILTIIMLSHDDHHISSSSLCLSLMQ